MWRRNLGASLLGVASASCHSSGAASAPPPESREQCVARLSAFEDSVAKLPDRTVAAVTGGDLPTSTLGALPGPGPVLQIAENGAAVDDTPLPGATHAERAAHLAEWSTATSSAAAETTAPAGSAARQAFYVAATADTDVQTMRAYVTKLPAAFDLRLLVRLPRPASGAPAADDPATRVLLEQDPQTRTRIAEQAYADLSHCPAVSAAVAQVRGLGPRERWPALKAALRSALPRCDCSGVDTVRLEQLVSAERQGGAGAMGFVPISFLRDERCGASMPLRSMRKLIKQVEQFDAEFAGSWQKDALAFGDVVTDARLLVYFCSALPGETLAQKERDRATLYLRTPGSASCEPWKFEPLAPGSPMGTWRRAAAATHPALAFHYWQAAEEIRVFGPIDAAAPSKPTDQRDWACEQTHRLTGIDDHYIQLDSGRWYFDDASCRRADPEVPATPPCTKSADLNGSATGAGGASPQ